MKKNNIFLYFLCLCFTQIFAFDQAVYKKLMQGGKKLTGANLQNATIKDIDLTDIDFTDSDLRGAKFNNVILTNVTFNNTKLDQAEFCDTVLRNSKILNETSLQYATFNNTTFDNIEINNSSFFHATFENSDFLLSNIKDISMELITAKKLYFVSSLLLKNVRFQEAILQNVLILTSGKIGEQLNFTKATLQNCCFLGMDYINYMNSNRSYLSQSNFYGTRILNCFFSNIYFNNCQQINEISRGSKSIFQNVGATRQGYFGIAEDLKAFKANGAKVNGKYDGVYRQVWDPKNKKEEDFFVGMLKSFGLGVASKYIPGLAIAASSSCCIQ